MPAPKQYKSGPRMASEREQSRASHGTTTKGKYAVSAPPQPVVDEEAVVEVEIDDITVVMPTTKYDRRSLHAYGDGPVPAEEDDLDEPEPEPVIAFELGEWRSESTLDGTHYHRKDSRLP